MKYTLPTLLTAAAVAVLPAAASASPLATEQHATSVSTAGDAIAWSSYDNGRYKLMLDQGGTVAAADVATSKTAFDVDLGTSKAGKLLAVYSRGGKLYQYDVAAGAEKNLQHPRHAADRRRRPPRLRRPQGRARPARTCAAAARPRPCSARRRSAAPSCRPTGSRS